MKVVLESLDGRHFCNNPFLGGGLKPAVIIGNSFSKARQQTSAYMAGSKDFTRSASRGAFLTAASFLDAQQRRGEAM